MRLKSFFADTVEEAIARARREMGADAMLVNSKPSGVEGRHLGAYEVVVCSEHPEAQRGSVPECAGPTTAHIPPSVTDLSQDVSELKRQMDRLALTLARGGGLGSDASLSKALALLTDAEFDIELVYEILGKIRSSPSDADLQTELASLINIDRELGRPESQQRIAALVGPPGSGKTSTLVKLLFHFGLRPRRSSQIISIDTYRIGAADELRSYAAILGVGCEIVETSDALAHALEEYRSKELILIDTPGLSRGEMDAFHDLADILANDGNIDTHLVLPASMRAADLKRVARQYAQFKPCKLLFTRLDETETFGPIVSESIRGALPLSFFCAGQRIPEDFMPATPDLVLDLIMNPKSAVSHKFSKAAA